MNEYLLLAGALYLAFCLGYAWLLARQAGSLQKGALGLVLGLALPGAGPLLLWFCDWRSRSGQTPDYRAFYRGSDFSPDDLRCLQSPDISAESDRIPLGQALQVSDRSCRRRMVMQLLDVEDPLAYLPVLRQALDNEDGETSHYASVAIMELRRKVQQQLDDAQARWRRDPRDREACARWEELLYQVLQTDLYDEEGRRRLRGRYRALSDRMLRDSHPDPACLHHRIRLEQQRGHTARAQQLCSWYRALYPDSEQAIRDQMTLCVAAKNDEGLQALLSSLRRRPVLLTAQTLAWVRAFGKEESHEPRS